MDTFKSSVILLVEDDHGDQKLIKTSLNNEKIVNELQIVDNAEEAIRYLTQCNSDDTQGPLPDLILLDLNMPGMGGKEFLKWIKEKPQFQTIPVVILTTSDTDKDILESYKLRASGYVKKPVTLRDFQQVMKSLAEYWFVICKRVKNESEYEHEENRCFVS